MLVYTQRCEHCGREYSYQASGEGCHNELNDKHLCPECKKAVLEALSRIPKKYCKKYMEIPMDNNLHDALKFIKEEQEKKESSGKVFRGMCVQTLESSALNYDHIELYEYNSYSYAICWNDNQEEHLFIMQEFDLIEKEFTKNKWSNGKDRNYHYFNQGMNMCRSLMKMAQNIKPRKLEPPTEDLLWWDIVPNTQ